MADFDLGFVEEFIDVSRRCTRPIELRDAFLGHVSRFGFENLAATNIDESPSVIKGREENAKEVTRLGTYPDIWMHRFFEQSYFSVDPVSQFVKETDTPFYWNNCDEEQRRGEGWTKLGQQFMAEASELELVRGITVPILNQDRRSAINLCGRHADNGPGVMHMMHLTSIYFHQKLMALGDAFTISNSFRPVHLTAREEEVLLWYAKGKSAWDIGAVLSVSESAVRFHLSNIRGKYGVTSSVHATALAISRNDIEI